MVLQVLNRSGWSSSAGPLFGNLIMNIQKCYTHAYIYIYILFKHAKANGAAQNQKDTFCTQLDTL